MKTVGRQLFIVLGTGSMSMAELELAESELRELTRVDDKGKLNSEIRFSNNTL